MKVLLTGGSGFIGGVIGRRLLAEGFDVTCAVRSSSDAPPNMKVVRTDLCEDDCVRSLCEASPQIDAVVHAAAFIHCQPFELELVDTNCRGTLQLLQYAREANAKTFVYLSSAPLIGKPQTSPILESHPVHSSTTYHATKRFGELLLGVVDEPDFACCSLRLSSPVGPGMAEKRIVSTFVRRALSGEPIQLAGKGLRRQNYVDVRDIATAVFQCLQRRPRGVFHVAGTEAISNRDLAELCVEKLQSDSKIEYSGVVDPADDESWDLSIEAARRAFGYEPCFSISDSINDIADHYRRRDVTHC